ncbi:MAG: lanthanide-dependent methanol dehydrogenase [Gemmatimonadales bacterium]|jgi:PQQ-dependent dehydrogenase (methanol/ethanol family)|nr:lanthanide-dependent methanol dehydrogenase [Gemmatimonadales bacterium]
MQSAAEAPWMAPSSIAGLSLWLIVGLPVSWLLACTRDRGDQPRADSLRPSTVRPAADTTNALDRFPDDGEWRIPAKDFASTRFSGLGQITVDNVARLQPAFTFSTGVLRGHEAVPIVAGSTMYVVTPHPNILYALDLARGGALKWRYDPGTARASRGVACCDVVNRGAAYAGGRVFFNTLDVHTVSVDAKTGKELWKVRLGDINRGESMTMAPLVVGDRVYVGNSGGEFGVRGWLTALDARTGKTLWRAYSTGPDQDLLIGSRFKPFYEADRVPNLGVSTWPADQWKIGGGAVWGWISYDSTMNAIFYGTSNPGTWNPALRPGDNKWASSVFARDADTGEALWAYQWTPHDEHDYDGINENILLDLPWAGTTRRLLVRPERNGFMYVLDRTTGEVLAADPYGPVNWASRIDLASGRPVLNPEKGTGDRQAKNVCPAAPGLKDWQPAAFSPRTRLLYIPHNNLCMDYAGGEANYIAGTPYVGAEVRMYAGPGGHRGVFTAWDPIARRKVWDIKERFPVWSGALVTAGNVVFYGTMDRWFKAVDARDGRLLWKFQVGSGIIGQPMTYRGPDGRQYVAILSGVGGWAGAAALGIMPEADPFIALGFADAMKDLPDHTAEGGTLHVFALPAGGPP